MSEQSTTDRADKAQPAMSVQDILRAELAYGDTVLGTVGPILGHLVMNHDHSLFTDAIVARVRGMLVDVARQLLELEGKHTPDPPVPDTDEEEAGGAAKVQADIAAMRTDDLVHAISGSSEFLEHCHALAIEFQVAERLKARNSLDPVLTPMLQAFIAAKEQDVASKGMAALTAQARFMEQQRRMVLPLEELPGSLLNHAIACWQGANNLDDPQAVASILADMRKASVPDNTRTALFSSLLSGAAGVTEKALALPHAGVSLFISALATSSGIPREKAALLTNDRQMARLALSLKAAGLQPRTIEEQFLYLHPEIELPENFDRMHAGEARTILGESTAMGASGR